MLKQEKKIYQIHGHRNHFNIDYNNYEYSYNLDGNIENGGFLRVLILNDNGTTDFKMIKNEKYDPKLIEKEKIYSLINNLRKNKYIIEKNLENNISSFNFSKEAFHKKIWDNMTSKARGLFIDTKNYLVIARSYDKFFNLDEREETKYDILKEKLKYPVNFYLKYNGFLGILSVYNNEFIFGTKSQLSGNFSNYFKNIFYKIFNEKQVNAIKNRLIDNETSMVFEVIDTTNDKHIIKYNHDKLILLDEINNSIDYSKTDYESIKEFALENKIEIKKLGYTAKNEKEFEEIFNNIKQEEYKYNDSYIEGFVVEDYQGFMFKYKTEYYKKWKVLRSKMEKALKCNDYNIKCSNELEIKFMKYLEEKYKDKDINFELINIIDERDNFEN